MCRLYASQSGSMWVLLVAKKVAKYVNQFSSQLQCLQISKPTTYSSQNPGLKSSNGVSRSVSKWHPMSFPRDCSPWKFWVSEPLKMPFLQPELLKNMDWFSKTAAPKPFQTPANHLSKKVDSTSHFSPKLSPFFCQWCNYTFLSPSNGVVAPFFHSPMVWLHLSSTLQWCSCTFLTPLNGVAAHFSSLWMALIRAKICA